MPIFEASYLADVSGEHHFIPSISAVGQARCQMDSQFGQKMKRALAEDSLQKCRSVLMSFNLTQDPLDTYKYLVQKLQPLLACDTHISQLSGAQFHQSHNLIRIVLKLRNSLPHLIVFINLI